MFALFEEVENAGSALALGAFTRGCNDLEVDFILAHQTGDVSGMLGETEAQRTQWSGRRKLRRAAPEQQQCPKRPIAQHRRMTLARPQRDEAWCRVSTERHNRRRRRADWRSSRRRVARRRGRGDGRRGQLPMPSWQPETFDVERLVGGVERAIAGVRDSAADGGYLCETARLRLALNCPTDSRRRAGERARCQGCSRQQSSPRQWRSER